MSCLTADSAASSNFSESGVAHLFEWLHRGPICHAPINMPASLTITKHASAHAIAENLGLKHETSGNGERRFLRVWFDEGS